MIPKRTINHRGGDVFDVSQEPSDRCVLWGELIKEKERRFLRSLLREELICFSVRDTFQISIRTVWRPESLCIPGARMIHRKGRFAMLLHDTVGRLTTSWTWLKMVQPLYQMGVSVILVDLPGMGKSSINNVSTLDPTVWRGNEGHILCHILDELKVSKCHVIAYGCSCSSLIRMLRHSPHQLEKEHILHNPVMDLDDIFKDSVEGPAPGAGPNWREQLHNQEQHELENFLVSTEAKIFATFDQAEQPGKRETYDCFMAARKHCVLQKNLQILDVTREDVCDAQVGANVPVHFLVLRKELRNRYTMALQSKVASGFNLGGTASGLNAVAAPLEPPRTTGYLTRGSTAVDTRPSTTLEVTRLPSPSGFASPPSRSKSGGMLEGAMFQEDEAQRRRRTSSASLRRGGPALTAQNAWYNDAFAMSPEWMAAMNIAAPSNELAYTSDDCKRESLSRLSRDPKDVRRGLLSALPARTRHNIRALAPGMMMTIKDPEPASQAEEDQMIAEAFRKSKQSLQEEVQARKRVHMHKPG